MTRRSRLLAASCIGIFLFGIVLSLLGTLFGLPGVREKLGVNMAQRGDILFLLFLGMVASTLASGPTIDRFGNKFVLVSSAAGVAFALAAFAFAQSFAAAAGAALVMGFGAGGLNTSANALVSDLYAEQRGAMLNILGMFYGIGALCAPFVAASLEAVFPVEKLLLGAAVAALLASLAFAALVFPLPREAAEFSLAEVFRAVRHPGVMVMAVLLFFASGNEASLGGWASAYLIEQGASPQRATFLLAGFWGCLTAGRLLASQLLRWIGKEQLVFFSGIGSFAGCALLVTSPAPSGRVAGVWIAGLSFAAIFPTTLAIAGERYARFAGSVFSVLFATGLIGGMSFSWAIGHLGESQGLRAGLCLPIVGALIITILVPLIKKMGRGAETSSAQ